MGNNLQVEWQTDDDQVKIRLTARIKPDQYIAFGLSSDQDK